MHAPVAPRRTLVAHALLSAAARGCSFARRRRCAALAVPPRRRRRHRARDAAGARSAQSLQRSRRRQAQPGGRRGIVARLRAEPCSNNVYVIDPATLQVVDRFPVGVSPQHVVPSWDLKTLWVANNGEGRTGGSLTPIDPDDRQARQPFPSTIPTTCTSRPTGVRRSSSPSGASGSIFATRRRWRCSNRSRRRNCSGINHADFSIDGRYAIFTCEFAAAGW